jgi:hypothetical protein
MQLVVLREVLYDGEWGEMVRDLEARKEGKPFVFQLKTRIEEDLERIALLRSYEEEHGVNLGKYVAQVHQTGRSQAT